MKTLFATVLLLGLVGCGPSAEEKQHHLYNIQQCKFEVEDFFKDFNWKDPLITGGGSTPQSLYDAQMTKCVADAEHTTTAFQFDKHDDYGKFEPRK